MKEIEGGGKGGASLGVITALVGRCLKEDWERREEERLKGLGGLLGSVVGALERERDGRIEELGEGEKEGIRKEYEERIQGVRRTFEAAGTVEKRKVPEWVKDDITFGIMIDPVVVRPLSLYTFFIQSQPLTFCRQKQETHTNAPP